MAKKPMTKPQIVSHFAEKFDLTRKTASGIIEEVAALAVSETKKVGSFTLPVDSGDTSLISWSPAVFSLVSTSVNCARSFSQCMPTAYDQPEDSLSSSPLKMGGTDTSLSDMMRILKHNDASHSCHAPNLPHPRRSVKRN